MRVTLNAPYQVVHDGRHYFAGDTIDVGDREARHWHQRGWVTLDNPPKQPETSSQRQGRYNVQARIREELRTDASRSDREIGKVVGCDGKTVASHRRKLTDGQTRG